jgi:NAD(P)-dependent dehydrogenase (short-subunit alcohol dehydrogenase family)
MMFDLTGRVALVTGAGQGVGVGIARALARQGATVVVNDLAAERAEATVEVIRADGGRAEAAVFDVTDLAGVEAAVERAGPVDILINNAGVPVGMHVAQFRDMVPSDWRRYIDLNVYGSLHCIHAVVDGMCDRGWGRVVQISSGAGRTGLAMGISLYGASKSGIEGFVRHLSQEVASNGVTVNAIALGLMDNAAGDATARLARAVPVGRLGSPDDVGAAVVYVASAEACWLTGQTINLNGGQVTS